MTMELMRASNANFDLLRYPVIVQPKMDGIRAVKRADALYSRTEKKIPNLAIQAWARQLPTGIDGELLLTDLTAPYRKVASAIMSRGGTPDFRFVIFDWASPTLEFKTYVQRHQVLATANLPFRCILVQSENCDDREDVEWWHGEFVNRGYEGIMIRNPSGFYKRGRATQHSQELLKFKMFDDDEAVVTGVYEEEECDTKRPKGTLGGINCRFPDGTEFGCGSGFTAEERVLFWADPSQLIGQTVTIKHQPPPGGRPNGTPPRFPTFKGIRRD